MAALSTEIFVLEKSLLKVPYEQLNRTFKSVRAIVDKGIKAAIASVDHLCQTTPQTTEINTQINALIEQLVALRTEVQDLTHLQATILEECELRIDHLKAGAATSTPEEVDVWRRRRLDRIIVDFLLREGHYETAVRLTADAGIKPLVNIDIFLSSREVERALWNKDCGPALAWCHANSARLSKLKSTLGFKLRRQEYLELLRTSKHREAIQYAEQHFPEHAQRHLADIQVAMAALLFEPQQPTASSRYRGLFEGDRWGDLVQQFRRNNFALHSLTAQSMLSLTLQAGLAAFKTPMCNELANKNTNCPVCSPHFNELAGELPSSCHINSKLVCRITGEIMNEDNPPMSLPNGYVYGLNGIHQVISQSTDNLFRCPRTGDKVPFSSIAKVYVM